MPAAVIFLRKKVNMGAGKANPRSILIELQVEDIHGLDSQFYFQVKEKKSDGKLFQFGSQGNFGTDG